MWGEQFVELGFGNFIVLGVITILSVQSPSAETPVRFNVFANQN